MTYASLLGRIVSLLEESEIAYMVTGSVASSFHGRPRATFDLDIVIDPTQRQLEEFLSRLGDEYYVSSAAAREAYEQRGMFNVIDYETGVKTDLILRKNRNFSQREFDRRKRESLMGVSGYVVTAEDSILSKLEWSKLGESGRQVSDVIDICRVNSDLDVEYLRDWAEHLGIADLLSQVLEASGRQ